MSDVADLAVMVEQEVAWPLASTFAESFTTKVLQVAAIRLRVSGEVSVMYVDDDRIHALNRSYRDVDRPTDVLSFSMLEGDEEFPELDGDSVPMLGDIVVSIDTAVRQAHDYGHSLEREIAFLLVHGFLHLNGYHHDDDEAEREMFGIQEAVLVELGLMRVKSP